MTTSFRIAAHGQDFQVQLNKVTDLFHPNYYQERQQWRNGCPPLPARPGPGPRSRPPTNCDIPHTGTHNKGLTVGKLISSTRRPLLASEDCHYTGSIKSTSGYAVLVMHMRPWCAKGL